MNDACSAEELSQQLNVQVSRDRRQAETRNTEANCDFGNGNSIDTCGWDNLDNVTSLKWSASKGDDAFWIGGPRHDHNTPNTLEGGYVFLETSSLAEDDSLNQGSALMESPVLSSTGSKGHCVTFTYAISGLSADRLRILLHPVNLDQDPEAPNFNNDVVLATLIDDTLGEWKAAQVLYTYPEEHTVIIYKDKARCPPPPPQSKHVWLIKTHSRLGLKARIALTANLVIKISCCTHTDS